MEEHEKRVDQVIESEARDAVCGRRHMLHEQQVLRQAGQREKEFVNSQMHSELQSHDREIQQERITQNVNTRKHT